MAKNNNDYSHIHDNIMREKTEQVRKTLPVFCDSFFIAKQDLSPATLYNYAVDLTVFFSWAKERVTQYNDCPIKNLPLSILESLSGDDISEYIKVYLTKYEQNGIIHNNESKGKARKLASLKSFYKHYLLNEKISKDATATVSLKKPADDPIVYLQPNEIAILLDYIDSGITNNDIAAQKNGKRADAWHKINRTRDLSIMTLLLGTGIRVSECIGLNLSDIDFNDGAIHITRKGHKRDIVYMGPEVESTLRDYITNARDYYKPSDGQDALYLSLRHTRLTVRSVEVMVKKYTAAALPYLMNEKVSPHKMRSTFGTNLYKETGDIKLVADTLGHKNISVTQKRYTASDSIIKRSAFLNVKLREE